MRRLLLIPVVAAGVALAQDAEPPMQIAKAIPVDADPPRPAVKSATKEESPDDSPIPLPPLDHFARLWTDSLFTTRALPAPDVPAGPTFTDNLTLSGTYEDNGKLTAVLIDRTTSGIVQAYIGVDNEEGIRISKIEPGASADKVRIQLQKGNQTGWVSFAEIPSGDGGTPAGAQAAAPAGGPLATRPGAVPQPTLFPQNAVPPPPVIPEATPAPGPMPRRDNRAGSLRGGMPSAPPTLPGDPPLPPP